MSRAHQPSSPSDDLPAYVDRHRSPAIGVLSQDIAAFCQSGISIVIAARSSKGDPVAGQALACEIDREGGMRVLLLRSANETLLEAFEAGSRIAATFSRPVDHRSIQLKGAAAKIVPTRPADEKLLAAQCAGMGRELVAVGYSKAFAAGYSAFAFPDIAAVAFVPEQIFVQTPGPGAGSRLLP